MAHSGLSSFRYYHFWPIHNGPSNFHRSLYPLGGSYYLYVSYLDESIRARVASIAEVAAGATGVGASRAIALDGELVEDDGQPLVGERGEVDDEALLAIPQRITGETLRRDEV